MGYMAAAYVIWLLAMTALKVYPWSTTRRHLFLVIALLGIWPLLNGYSEIWRNFGAPPGTNPAINLALFMLGYSLLLIAVAFSNLSAEDLVARLYKSGFEGLSGSIAITSAGIYQAVDPSVIMALFEGDSWTFAAAQLLIGCLLVVAVLVIESSFRRVPTKDARSVQ